MALRASVDVRRAIEEIVRLRRAERRAGEPTIREELAVARRLLEDLVGSTVRRAEAARLLGISQTALDRWVAAGEVPSVVTAAGRREIPLPGLVRLLDEVEQARERGATRPLSAVLHERRRRSQAIDVDRLIPPPGSRRRPVSELQALATHRLIADRLDPDVVGDARMRLARWREDGRLDPRWADAWERLLELPLEELATEIGADTPRAHALRQSSPFAGALTEQERQVLLRAVAGRR